MTAEADRLLEQAYEQFRFSTRAYHKILKVARTIADMEEAEKILPEHIRRLLPIGLMIKILVIKQQKGRYFIMEEIQKTEIHYVEKTAAFIRQGFGNFPVCQNSYIILEDFRKIINRQQRSLGPDYAVPMEGYRHFGTGNF